MSEIMKKAIALDKQARAEVEATKMRKANIHETLAAHKKKIEEEYLEEYEKQIASYQEKQKKRYEKQKIKNEEEKEKAVAQLEEIFKEHQEEWINTIYTRILSHF